MNGVVLTFESGASSGAFEDGSDGSWTAEAQRGGIPYAEASGDTPLNAVMALANTLAAMVSGDRTAAALERLEVARGDAELQAETPELTPEQAEALRVAKERLERKRREAAIAGVDG